MAATGPIVATALTDLVPRLLQSEGLVEVAAALARGESAAVDGAWGSSCALTAAAIASRCPGMLLVVLPRPSEVDDFAADVMGFLGTPPDVFPAWESLPQESGVRDPIYGGRLRVLRRLGSDEPPRVIVTSVSALLQPVPPRAERAAGTRTVRVGETLEIDGLLRWLVEQGFERVPAIEIAGEFCMHGGILDLFPADAEDPIRIELFGEEVESIRRFDAETQRKLEDLTEVELTIVGARKEPAADLGESAAEDKGPRSDRTANDRAAEESLIDSLPAGTWIALGELADIVDEGKAYLMRMENPRGLFTVAHTLERLTKFPSLTVAAIAGDSYDTTCHLRVESIERFSGPRTEALAELESVVGRDEQVLIACHNEGERTRLAELLAEPGRTLGGRVELCIGHVTHGFRLVAEGLIILSDQELFGRTEIRREARRRTYETRAIDTFLELSEGDLIVHLTNGIGIYRGMELLDKGDQKEEHLILEFADNVRVYVPISLIYLVQKYIGASKSAPQLSKLGSATWAKKKERVASAVLDLASDMIQLQARREAREGIAFPVDSHWQQEFEAAFPYTETKDQASAIIDVKEDMQRLRPMDRLLCGDVGYGKTEVAMRAAFKAVEAGKQVAVLVPTTVLAEQHFRTFSERLAEFPFNVHVLSRFRTKGQQQETLLGMETGEVDIVVGTHRMVQKDVRFKDLGLLVIDEEQRFGVDAKEMLKRLRLEVDVLTMSATPIPRTLHLSLLGIRDISNLTTPPRDRQAIETRICRFDAELIRKAIVRELNRNGQVFFVHNRVYNIRTLADRLQSIVPEARFDVAHGQMGEHQLEEAMFKFVTGKTDVLVCTTIVESGLDIPNANTIFIHQAGKYGLADMHQLRGRVGRYKHRAYCYLLLEEGQTLTSTAARRLKAIEEFSELGAGFKIAMRDLEIRGAGNILGTEQSGHITSVGYELYCRLLDNAVRSLKNEPVREPFHVGIDLPVSAFLPGSYVSSMKQKIEIYRKLSQIETVEQLAEWEAELRDRFGPLPPEVERLREVRQLQVFAHHWQIDDIHLEAPKYAVFRYRNPRKMGQLAKRWEGQLRVVDALSAYLVLPERELSTDELVATLKSVLQPA
jgi:transcription-repair coupling factor (superfamily II helicase)